MRHPVWGWQSLERGNATALPQPSSFLRVRTVFVPEQPIRPERAYSFIRDPSEGWVIEEEAFLFMWHHRVAGTRPVAGIVVSGLERGECGSRGETVEGSTSRVVSPELATSGVASGGDILADGLLACDEEIVVTVGRSLDRAVKRALDVAVAGVLLAALLPLCALIAAGILLDSRGSVFYVCRRAGYRGRELRMLKFRKMVSDAQGPTLTVAEDTRFTRVGRVLAATKLDELPQLWNVLRGDMSLVGPRPEDPQFVALHTDEFGSILGLRPGITGLCQLAFAKEGEILDRDDRVRHYVDALLPQKIRLDLFYVTNRTIWMDLNVLLWTVLVTVLRQDAAVDRRTGRIGIRRRPSRVGREGHITADLPDAPVTGP